ncbi:hypothetical protein T484DRAFT_1850438 [Baffinella frigidus]|nr:hypothetical protein T484DRAFT_1850438 [Cryptophyta sp. CCMP2293]
MTAGLGCSLSRTSDGALCVSAVKAGGAGQKAGIQEGDVLLAVDGSPLDGMSQLLSARVTAEANCPR